ncbi:MAG: hypothetical protein KUG64_10495 [Cycloclasticus sp.]|nr:hypothetical protein [Cycloclasticus sp.]
MKHLFITLLLLFTANSAMHSQNILEGIDIVADTVETLNDAEQTIVGYVQDVMPTIKETAGTLSTKIEKAVAVIWEESTIVVEQYVAFTAITFLIPILLGLFLIWFLPKRIIKFFSINDTIATAHNATIEGSKEAEYKKDTPYTKVGDHFYKTRRMGTVYNILSWIPYAFAAYLIIPNLLPFIKITFFTKLYLVELVTQHLL